MHAPKAIPHGTSRSFLGALVCASAFALSAPVSAQQTKMIQDVENAPREKTVPCLPMHEKNPIPMSRNRSLTAGEIKAAQSIFGDDIRYGSVQVMLAGRSFNNALAFQDGIMAGTSDRWSNDYSASPDTNQQRRFFHEMTHLWQFHTGQCLDNTRQYHYKLAPDTQFLRLPAEAQAVLVADYALEFFVPGASTKSDADRLLIMQVVETQFPRAKEARLDAQPESRPAALMPANRP